MRRDSGLTAAQLPGDSVPWPRSGYRVHGVADPPSFSNVRLGTETGRRAPSDVIGNSAHRLATDAQIVTIRVVQAIMGTQTITASH